jgi:hypothetical protein
VLLQHLKPVSVPAADALPSSASGAAGASTEGARPPVEQLTTRKDLALAVLDRLREQSAAALRRTADFGAASPASPMLASVSGFGDAMLRLISPHPIPAEPLPPGHRPLPPSRSAGAQSPVPGAPYGGRVMVEWCAELEFVYRLLSSEEIHSVLATADAAWDSTTAIRTQLAGNDKAVRDWIRDNYGDADSATSDDEPDSGAEGAADAPAVEHVAAAQDGLDADCSINPRLATGRMQRRWKRTGSATPPVRAPSDGVALAPPAAPTQDADLQLCALFDASLGAPHAPLDDGRTASLHRWRARVRAADPTLSLFELKREIADPLTFVLLALLEEHGLAASFSLGFARVSAFCAGLNAGYVAANPFHNELHATDVLFATHLILKESALVAQQGLSGHEVLALLIAAVCHDFRHPGVSNAHLVAANDPLALVYNDRSVLENYHASETFKLMAAPERNLLHALEPKAARDVRQAIVRMILATDMADHFATVTELVSTAPHVPAPAAKQMVRAREGARARWAGQVACRALRGRSGSAPSAVGPCWCRAAHLRVSLVWFLRSMRARAHARPVAVRSLARRDPHCASDRACAHSAPARRRTTTCSSDYTAAARTGTRTIRTTPPASARSDFSRSSCTRRTSRTRSEAASARTSSGPTACAQSSTCRATWSARGACRCGARRARALGIRPAPAATPGAGSLTRAPVPPAPPAVRSRRCATARAQSPPPSRRHRSASSTRSCSRSSRRSRCTCPRCTARWATWASRARTGWR